MKKDDLESILLGHLQEYINKNYSPTESFAVIHEQILANPDFAQLDRDAVTRALNTIETNRSKNNIEGSSARLLVDWGETPQVGHNARPLFSLIAPSNIGKPAIRVRVDNSLDNDPLDPLRQLQMEEDGLWTFYIPFCLTTNGIDAKSGLYIIDVEVTFPSTENVHPRFLQTRIRLKIQNDSLNERELVIDGDGQSVVNLAGQDLKSFSKVVLKGDDRGIINVQNLSSPPRLAAEPEQNLVFEYKLKINRHVQDKLPRLMNVSQPSKTDTITLVIGERRVHLIARKKITLGRSRENDICLRFLPRTPENDDGSRGISKTHVAFTLSSDGLGITDERSTHGVDIDYDRVEKTYQLTRHDAQGTRHIDLPAQTSSTKISLQMELNVFGRDPGDPHSASEFDWDDICFDATGESPSSPWHIAKNCGIESARIRRLNNLADEEYVFLYRHATIGRSAKDHTISLPHDNKSSGEVRVLYAGRMFWIHSTGEVALTVDGESIVGPCLIPLMFGHHLSINGIDIYLSKLSQFHLHNDPTPPSLKKKTESSLKSSVTTHPDTTESPPDPPPTGGIKKDSVTTDSQSDQLPVRTEDVQTPKVSKTIIDCIPAPKPNIRPRYLTKSRFNIACSCPTKLFYTNKAHEYENSRSRNSLLKTLANEGNRVGALARLYFPDGHLIETLNHNDALAQTDELLLQEEVTLFEAAIRADNLFIRVDILRKHGDSIQLFEVKSKAYSEQDDEDLTNNARVTSEWLPYVRDVAFQKLVLLRAFPEKHLRTFLFLPDKTKPSPSSDLARKCFESNISTDTLLTETEQSSPIMQAINTDHLCSQVFDDSYQIENQSLDFSTYVNTLAAAYREDRKFSPLLTTACIDCEFAIDKRSHMTGLKSGRDECWSEILDWSETDFNRPLAFEINGLSKAKKETLLNERRLHIDQVNENDINPTKNDKPGLSLSQRQWMQVRKSIEGDNDSYFDRDGMHDEIATWQFPLHFIDFETCRPAIPFHAGSRPSSLIAFQFSHHVMNADGTVEHAHEFLCTSRQENPNLSFVEALYKAVGDTGTIVHYAAHEISTLRTINWQLQKHQKKKWNRDALIPFMDSIAPRGNQSASRSVVDLCQLVKRFYYAPSTRGSNSIKAILPAILNDSKYLKDRYTQPMYGAIDGIPSKNFQNMSWYTTVNGTVQDPYSLLPTISATDADDSKTEHCIALRNGSSAMQAYADLQCRDWTEQRIQETKLALVRYCELDTLAMVFIVEAWQDWCR